MKRKIALIIILSSILYSCGPRRYKCGPYRRCESIKEFKSLEKYNSYSLESNCKLV